MRTYQKGFTIIELMIAVAIIGILAAIAVPSYQGYITRAKVSEGFSVATGLETAVSEFYQSNGIMPVDSASIGLSTTSTTNGIGGINSISITNGTINITMSTSIANNTGTGPSGSTNTPGGTFTLTPTTSAIGISWKCANVTVGTKYLPSSCR